MRSSALSRARLPLSVRRARRGFTLIELIVVVVIIGVLLTIAVVDFSSSKRGQQDRAGYVLLGAAQSDSSQVANASGYTFSGGTQGTLAALNRIGQSSRTASGTTLTYVTDPSPDAQHMSFAYGDAVTVGFAVMSSVSNGNGHCEFLINSLKTGTHYARDWNALRNGQNYCGAQIVVACASTMASQGAGTQSSPWIVPTDPTQCQNGQNQASVAAPQCMVGQPAQSAQGTSQAAVRLTWVPSTDASNTASYTVIASGTTSKTTTGIDPASKSYLFDGLVPGGSYTFKIYGLTASQAAAEKAGSFNYSTLTPTLFPTVGATIATAPSATTFPTRAAIEANDVDVKFNAVQGATSYTISRTPAFTATPTVINATDSSGNPVTSGTVAGGQWTLSNGVYDFKDTNPAGVKDSTGNYPIPGQSSSSTQQWTYRVTSSNASPGGSNCSVGYTSGGSAQSDGTTTPVVLPKTNLTVDSAQDANGGKFILNWAAQPNAIGYQIEYQTLAYGRNTPTSSWSVVVANAGNVTTWTMSGVAPGTVGNFRVSVLYPNSNVSDPSNEAHAVVAPAAPQAITVNWPAGSGNTVSNVSEYPHAPGQDNVTWIATAATDGYRVIDAATNNVIATVAQPTGASPGVTKVSMPDQVAALGSNVTYRVQSYNTKTSTSTQQWSGLSNPKSVLQFPPAPQIAPANTDGSGSRDLTGQQNLTRWSAASSATSYSVERLKYAGTTWACATSSCAPAGFGSTGPVPALSFTDNNGGSLFPYASQYSYRVWSYNATGRSPSPSSTVTLTQVPAAPPMTVSDGPDLNSNASTLRVTTNADQGTPGFCSPSVCQYKITDSNSSTWNHQVNSTGAPTIDITGDGTQTWGQTYNYYGQAHNQAITNGGWSAKSTSKVNTYPGPFGISAASTGIGPAAQYTYTSVHNTSQGDSNQAYCVSSCGSGRSVAVVTWGRSAGAVTYAWSRSGPAGSPSPNSGSTTATTTGSVPILEGGYAYAYSVKATAHNGLTRTVGGSSSGLVQSSPTLPSRIGLVQMCGAGNDPYQWRLKFYALKSPIASGGGSVDMRMWAVASRTGQSSSQTGWQSASGGFINYSPQQVKGADNIIVYFQTRVTRSGAVNSQVVSPLAALKFTTVSYDPWAGCMANGDVTYSQAYYPASYPYGYERFSAGSGGSWAAGTRLPGTEFN